MAGVPHSAQQHSKGGGTLVPTLTPLPPLPPPQEESHLAGGQASTKEGRGCHQCECCPSPHRIPFWGRPPLGGCSVYTPPFSLPRPCAPIWSCTPPNPPQTPLSLPPQDEAEPGTRTSGQPAGEYGDYNSQCAPRSAPVAGHAGKCSPAAGGLLGGSFRGRGGVWGAAPPPPRPTSLAALSPQSPCGGPGRRPAPRCPGGFGVGRGTGDWGWAGGGFRVPMHGVRGAGGGPLVPPEQDLGDSCWDAGGGQAGWGLPKTQNGGHSGRSEGVPNLFLHPQDEVGSPSCPR